jgi:purine-nucleoside phosphorylase
LGNFVDELHDRKELAYSEIPGAPQTSVAGHAGKLVRGKLYGDRWVLCMAGRTHGYEGKYMYELNFMARMLAYCGVKLLIATNASGGCLPGMLPGCLMIINDHINFYKRNPLAGISFFLTKP